MMHITRLPSESNSNFGRKLRTGALIVGSFVVLAGFQNCSFLPGAMKAAMVSLASSSPLPNGIYGVSPTSLQLKYSDKAGLSNLVVYSTSTSGKDSKLRTNFNSGNITGLTANTFYMLNVRGVLPNGSETPNTLAAYQVQTWDTFATSTWTLKGAAADPTQVSLNGSAYTINWTYAPWSKVPAGDGIKAATTMRCYFVPDKGPSTNPFVATAPYVDAGVEQQNMTITAGAIGLSGNVRIGCQVIYADSTISRSNQTQLTLLLPALKPCPATTLNVYTPYACSTTDLFGASGAGAGLTISFDNTNTCTWLKADANGITGTPRDPAVGTCKLAYKVTSSTGTSSPVLTQTLTIKNTAPTWIKLPNPPKSMREVSRNDPGTLAGGAFSPASLLTNSAYALHMVDQFQTNKAAYGVIDGAVYGTYRVDSTTSSNCAAKGNYFYPNATGQMVSGINPTTGEFYFQPFEYVYGACTVDIVFDDGHPEDNLSEKISITANFKGFNDPPQIVDPGFPTNGPGGSQLYDCGSNCYLGIDYFVSLQANTGGINPDHPTITGEGDQHTLIKAGNCVAVNSPASDPTVYVRLNYCQLDTSTGNILVGFQPIALPMNGTTVAVKVVVSDDAVSTLPSAFNPQVSGNSTTCLANTGCQSYPASYGDSAVVSFALKLAQFDMPIQPALIVSKGACLACHLTVTAGDYVTDLGNTSPGASSRFPNHFWDNKGDWTNSSNHIEGYRSINQLAGNFYVKRASLTPAANPGFFSAVNSVQSKNSGAYYPSPLSAASSVNLIDFLSSWNWTYNGNRYTDGYVKQNNAFVSICPGPNVADDAASPKSCSPAPVRDTIGTGSDVKPIDYLTISAPTVADIQTIARAAPGIASQIDWGSANAAVAPLYLIPTDTNVTPRPFAGLVVSNKQPASAVLPGQAAKTAKQTFVTNSGTIQCYGDVVVKGDLFLEEPAFVSDSRGCRIHVTGSVIFHARATTDPGAPAVGSRVTGSGNVGVQITSVVAIAMGFTKSEASHRTLPAATTTMIENLYLPETAACMTPSQTFEPLNSAGACPAGTTAPNDGTTLPPGYVGWDWGYANYSGLMLNAPQVQGRYQGQLRGSVIADYALFRLGHMNFAFDTRFTGQVPFPRLQTIRSSLGNHPRVIFDAGACTGGAGDSWQCDPNAVQ